VPRKSSFALSTGKILTKKPHAKSSEALDDLVRQIVATVHPLKVILFGSRARGVARFDSDYDIMVVVRNGSNRRHVRQRLFVALSGNEINYDLLVSTPEDFERYGYHPSLVYKYILEEGVDLYVA
jgi:predicted nucleotidyltransferase